MHDSGPIPFLLMRLQTPDLTGARAPAAGKKGREASQQRAQAGATQAGVGDSQRAEEAK